MEPKKVKMHINIAGEVITLKDVAEDQQESVRRTESYVNRLYADWRAIFRKRTTQYILAMMAFNISSKFLELCDDLDEASVDLQGLESQIGETLASS